MTGGNRPVALLGMPAVLLAVEDVVKKIDAAAQQDEAEGRPCATYHVGNVKEVFGKDEGGKD